MSILITKVSLPERRKDVLRRARLIDALHQNLHRKLIFVSAPAGYGKTTLLVDFASDVNAVVCWYRISLEDTDLISFAQHLVAAFRQEFPQFGDGFIDTFSTSGTISPLIIATEFINEIVVHIDDYCVLMLDDYHLVGENQIIVDFIEILLEHLPDQVRVIIASRSIYGVPSTTLYVRDELATLGAQDLRFRADELQALVRQNHSFKLSDEQAADLALRSDGWIVAIMLAIRTMKHDKLPKFEEAVDQVYSFLAEEVVNQQQPKLQEFLLATSILDEFNEALCDHLLQTSSSGELLSELQERNLFISRIETNHGVSYRYHQLFSDYLRQRLVEIDFKRVQRLHARAANWYRQNDSWKLAIHHILEADESQKAALWMDQAATEFFVRGQQNILSHWYDALEKVQLRDHAPRLLLYQAKIWTNQSAFGDAEALLDVAEPLLRRDGDTDHVVNVAITRGMIRCFQGNFQTALALGEEAQTNLALKDRRESYWWYQADRLKGKSLSALNQTDLALECFQKAVTGLKSSLEEVEFSYQRAQREYDLAETLNDMGLACLRKGDLLQAQICFTDALKIKRKMRGNRGALSVALNNAGYVNYMIGNYAEAWLAYEEALEHARLSGWNRVLVDLYNSRSDLLRDIEEFDEAEISYSTAREIGESNHEQIALIDTYSGLSEFERIRGDYQQAFHWLREAARYRNDTFESPDYQAGLGAIYLEMGQNDLACEAFEKALDSWEIDSQPQQEQVRVAFLLGAAYYRQKRSQRAQETLTKALKWSAQLGYDQFLVVAGRRCKDFVSYAVTTWPDHTQLKSIAQRIEQAPAGLANFREKASPSEIPETHLEVRGFGPGQVWLNGELIPRAKWRSSGALALFFYIIQHGEVRKEEVGLEFWPEFSAAKISSNFHATLWRVRQALGEREIISFRDKKYFLNPCVTIWFDVSEFHNQMTCAEDVELSSTQRTDHFRQAIALYRGNYLEEIFMDWSIRKSDELKRMYLRALADLAEWENDRRRFDNAISLYEKVLEGDPYSDSIHLALMQCLADAGSPTMAKAHYQKYEV